MLKHTYKATEMDYDSPCVEGDSKERAKVTPSMHLTLSEEQIKTLAIDEEVTITLTGTIESLNVSKHDAGIRMRLISSEVPGGEQSKAIDSLLES